MQVYNIILFFNTKFDLNFERIGVVLGDTSDWVIGLEAVGPWS